MLLFARRVGPAGFGYGVDMTDDLLDLARANAVALNHGHRRPGPRHVGAVSERGEPSYLAAALRSAATTARSCRGDDPGFTGNVELIKERWQQAVAGTAGYLDPPVPY